MSKMFLYISLLIVLLNTTFGVISSHYETFNWICNDIIILLNSAIVYNLFNSNQKDGFKISFGIILSLIGIVQFALCLFMEQKLQNNHILLFIVIFFILQMFFVIIGKFFSGYVE